MNEALTKIEQGTLQAFEAVIEKGLASFVEVGRALKQIQESGLYRAHGTFEAYCQKRWAMSERRVYQVIEASGVSDRLKKFSGTQPNLTESHAAELAELPADEQADAYEEALATAPQGKVTAKHIKAVVENRKEQSSTSSKPRTSKPPKQTAMLWSQIRGLVAKASQLFSENCQECDESADVNAEFESLIEKFDYYVKGVES